MSSEKKPRIVGVIPARLNSERLPGKVLRPLAGRAMLHHVYEGARACLLLDELLVANFNRGLSKRDVPHSDNVSIVPGRGGGGMRNGNPKFPHDFIR